MAPPVLGTPKACRAQYVANPHFDSELQGRERLTKGKFRKAYRNRQPCQEISPANLNTFRVVEGSGEDYPEDDYLRLV
jgi:hypothetical protein